MARRYQENGIFLSRPWQRVQKAEIGASGDGVVPDSDFSWLIFALLQLLRFRACQLLEVLGRDHRLARLLLDIFARPAGHRAAVLCIFREWLHAV